MWAVLFTVVFTTVSRRKFYGLVCNKKFISYFSDFQPECESLASAITPLLGYSAIDLGLELRGLNITSNFCPLNPHVYSLDIYVQHPLDENAELIHNHRSQDYYDTLRK